MADCRHHVLGLLVNCNEAQLVLNKLGIDGSKGDEPGLNLVGSAGVWTPHNSKIDQLPTNSRLVRFIKKYSDKPFIDEG